MSVGDRERLLEIYLDDHWAGAGAGGALAWRLYRNNRRTNWGGRLGDLARQVERDNETLAQLRRSLGFEGGRTKRALAIAAERAARLKPNGRLVTYSPLSRVIEIESLMAGIQAKRRLWTALRNGMGGDPAVAALDFEALERDADEQLGLLHTFHVEAASEAFGRSSTSGHSVD